MAGTAVRKLATDNPSAPLDSFIFDTAELSELSTRNLADGKGSSGWTMPEGRHILLAACQDNELAKEYNAEGKSWGTFSYFLRTTLQTTTRPLATTNFMPVLACVWRAVSLPNDPSSKPATYPTFISPF